MRLVLVSDQLLSPYIEMLQGDTAGLYRRDAMHIDLAGLGTGDSHDLLYTRPRHRSGQGVRYTSGRRVGASQTRYFVLLMTDDRRAIRARGQWPAVEGHWVWWLKDSIDRRFIARFATSVTR